MQTNREQFLQELKLRKIIRKGISIVLEKKETEKENEKRAMQVKPEGEYEWVERDGIVDSGAVGIIASKKVIGGSEIRQTEMSKRGGRYASASGDAIKNLGECDLNAIGADGTPIKMTTQVGDKVNRLIIAVREIERATSPFEKDVRILEVAPPGAEARIITPTANSGDMGHSLTRIKAMIGKKII